MDRLKKIFGGKKNTAFKPAVGKGNMNQLMNHCVAGDVDAACHLLDTHPTWPLNDVNKDGWTALHLAAVHEPTGQIVTRLLEAKASTEVKNVAEFTPLHLAVFHGKDKCVELLLNHGADATDTAGETDLTPLEIACERGRLGIVKLLLETPKTPKELGPNALAIACGNPNVDIVKALLAESFDCEAKDMSNMTPLHNAALKGEEKVLQVLIDAGADVNAPHRAKQNMPSMVFQGMPMAYTPDSGSVQNTALIIAAKEGHLGCVRKLLDAGAEVDKADFKNCTALHAAIMAQSLEIVSLLVERGASMEKSFRMGMIDPAESMQFMLAAMRLPDDHPAHPAAQKALRESGGKQVTPLALAVLSDQVDMTRWLIDHGVDVNSKENEKGATALHIALNVNAKAEIIDLLLEAGADVSAVSEESNFSPLHEAARAGNIDALKKFLARGASATAKTKEGGKAPITLAAINDKTECVAYLLERDPDSLDIKDDEGQTPLSFAVLKGNNDLIKLLIGRGADIHVMASDSISLFDMGIVRGINAEAVQAFIDAGVDVNKSASEGDSTPLHFACGRGSPDVVQALLKAGAKVDVQESSAGHYPIHMAAMSGQLDVIRMLVEKGADVRVKDASGLAAHKLAEQNNHAAAARLLRAYHV